MLFVVVLEILASRVLAFVVYQATPRDPLILAGVVLAIIAAMVGYPGRNLLQRRNATNLQCSSKKDATALSFSLLPIRTSSVISLPADANPSARDPEERQPLAPL
jgi:hypothetical protein